MSKPKPETKPRVHQATIEKNPKGNLANLDGAKFDAWNNLILNATVNAVRSNGTRPEDLSLKIDALVSGMLSIRPADPVEGIIVSQLMAANQASLSMYQRAWDQPPENFEVRLKYLRLADKAARTAMMLTERLDHHRGRGQQRIVVQHVNSTTNNVTTNQAVVTESVVTGNAAC